MDILNYIGFVHLLQCVKPMVVSTSMNKKHVKEPKWWAPSGVSYARSAVATIGLQRDTYGCLSHAFQVTMATKYKLNKV